MIILQLIKLTKLKLKVLKSNFQRKKEIINTDKLAIIDKISLKFYFRSYIIIFFIIISLLFYKNMAQWRL